MASSPALDAFGGKVFQGAVRISGITVLLDQPSKGIPSVKLVLNGATFIKHEFKKGELRLRLDFKPLFTLQQGSQLAIQFREKSFIWPANVKLAESLLSFDDAQRILSSSDGQSHTLHDNPKIIVDFATDADSMPKMFSIAGEIARDRKSILGHLGRSGTFLKTLLDFGTAASEVHPVAKAVLASVNTVYNYLQKQEVSNQLVLDLAENMARILGYIGDMQQFASLVQLKTAIEDVQSLLEDTTNFIIQHSYHSETENTMRALYSSSNQDQIDNLTKRFEVFKQQFDRGVSVQSAMTLEAVLNAITSTQDDALLAELKPKDIGRGSPTEECMDGTRQDILTTIDGWIEDLHAPNILWLRGHPGVGKSAIAASVVKRLQSSRRLGSSFFFQRDKAILTTPAALWRMVAFDLARKYPSARKAIVATLNAEEVGPSTANVNELFRCLIHEPLMACTDIPRGRLPVIVVDALDECGGLDGWRSNYRTSLLHTLKSWSHLPSGFKLMITSRGEDDIADAFSAIGHKLVDIASGQMVSVRSSDDVRSFLERRFLSIAAQYRRSLPLDWPGPQIIDELAGRAAGLFIYAETILRFIVRGEPRQQLQQIRQGDVRNGDMGELYMRILSISFPDPTTEVLEAFHSIVGAIILAKVPIAHSSLVALLQIETSMMDFVYQGLRSILHTDDVLRFSHQSSVDFLVDSRRCPPMFLIQSEVQNRQLVHACLHVMKHNLQFNICNIPSSYYRNEDVDGLSEQIESHISPQLSYSCCFMAHHLLEIAYEQDIVEELWNFMNKQFLHWLEVLSLTKKANLASEVLSSIATWIKTQVELSALIMDAIRFVAAFANIISHSVPHIYLSALPFAPTESLVSRRHLQQYPHTLSIQIGVVHHWPAIQNVLAGHTSSVVSVACSPDGKHIVSGSPDKTIRVWDAETGDTVLGPFVGHTDGINSIAFSPNGQHIVSGSDDKTIRVWDVDTGDVISGPFEGHDDWVSSVAFSPDGKHIVSGSGDKTVRLWDTEKGTMSCLFEGHTDWVHSVAFSPDGRHIVSGSRDLTIKVWDAETGDVLLDLFEGHTSESWVTCIAFSPDGKHIISGSVDKTIRMWDTETGDVILGPLKGHMDGITSATFSPDGKHIVSGSLDKTIRLWNAETGDVVSGLFTGHSDGITSVVFSPDGKHIISGSEDKTIRVWDADTGDVLSHPFKGHTDKVTSVAFSFDSKWIVSGSHDKTIMIWNAETGDIVSGPFKEHTHPVFSVAFSPDGKHIVSGSGDGMIRIWDVETGDIVSGPFEGHISDYPITSVMFSPDGKHLVSGSADKTIRVWDAWMEEPVSSVFGGHTDWVNSVAFSPDGEYIVSGSDDNTIRVWHAETGDVVAGPFKGHTDWIKSVGFSPDGKHIVSGSHDKTIRVWHAETGEIVAGPFEGHTDWIKSVAFSPDGKHIISGSVDNTMRVWHAETGDEVGAGIFRGHTDWVNSVAFSPNGKWIVSGSHDNSIRVWDTEKGIVLSSPFKEHTNPVTSTPDVSKYDRGIAGSTIQALDSNQTLSAPLRNPPGIFTDSSCIDDNGWIIGEHGELILWIPPLHRANLFRPSNICIIGANVTRLDLSHFVHGTSWTQCHM